ncbi:hypothetical protein CCR75_001596 [Bremia lactucae]|uniref:Uncharacterized protein n=1 Tax=Bremia lactucae TaxID=4779 RepID=A0A976ID43_BRELC|nr:hypothetical protein CCR75_001596 [Bremia lactucae]
MTVSTSATKEKPLSTKERNETSQAPGNDEETSQSSENEDESTGDQEGTEDDGAKESNNESEEGKDDEDGEKEDYYYLPINESNYDEVPYSIQSSYVFVLEDALGIAFERLHPRDETLLGKHAIRWQPTLPPQHR